MIAPGFARSTISISGPNSHGYDESRDALTYAGHLMCFKACEVKQKGTLMKHNESEVSYIRRGKEHEHHHTFYTHQ